MSPAGDLAHNTGMCPDWESSWQPFGLQAGAQSTEPHHPGPGLRLLQRKCVSLLKAVSSYNQNQMSCFILLIIYYIGLLKGIWQMLFI